MEAAGIQKEREAMKCRVCGAVHLRIKTDLPFKTGEHTIVVMKGIPVYQCGHCAEYSLDDATVARVDELLAHVGPSTEVEIISFAA
jgi:YgiT-type zinc finger domain-containing protein